MLGGFLNIEGVDLAERGEDPRVVPGRSARDPNLRRARAGRRRRPRRRGPGGDPAVHRRARARHPRGGARSRPRRPRRSSTPATGSTPELTRAEVERTLPLLGGDEPGKPFGYMNPREWEDVRRLLRRPWPDLQPPRGLRAAHQRAAPGGDPGLIRPGARRASRISAGCAAPGTWPRRGHQPPPRALKSTSVALSPTSPASSSDWAGQNCSFSGSVAGRAGPVARAAPRG